VLGFRNPEKSRNFLTAAVLRRLPFFLATDFAGDALDFLADSHLAANLCDKRSKKVYESANSNTSMADLVESLDLLNRFLIASRRGMLGLARGFSFLKSRVRWYLIAWMFVISAVAYLDRVNISVAGRAMETEFGLSDVQLGWVFSSFVLGYALFQAPGGWIADRFGPRRVIAFATIWWGIFTALTGLTPAGFAGAIALLMVIRFGLGLGESVVYPASNRLVANWIPSEERGLANGLIFAGVGAGAGLSPPLVTWVMIHYGWRASFVLSAVLGAFAGLVWFLLCRDKPDAHPCTDAQERQYVQSRLPKQARSGQAPKWGEILSNRTVLALTFSYAAFGYAAYIFFSWFFIYLTKVRNLDLKSSAFYSMLPFIAMAIGSPLGGWISDRLSKRFGARTARCGLAGVSIACAAVFIALGPRVQDVRLASVVLAGGAGALYMSQSMFWSVTSEIGGSAAGSVSGVMNMGNQLAGALTASLSPFIAASMGWSGSFAVAAALCVMGALAWYFVDPMTVIRQNAATIEGGCSDSQGVPAR
jgi:ACS family glucarate transporter-like MFS transporter